MARSYPYNDYPYNSYPYRSFPYTSYPYGDAGEERGGAISRRTGGAHSGGSIAWSVVVLIGLAILLAFKIIRLLFRILFAIIRHLKRRDPHRGSPILK